MTAARRTCVTKVAGRAYPRRRRCCSPCCWLQSAAFLSKSMPGGLLLNILFLSIPSFVWCCVPKAFYFPTGSCWERLKLAWVTWIIEELRKTLKTSPLGREDLFELKKVKSEPHVIWVRWHGSYSVLCEVSCAGTAWGAALKSSDVSLWVLGCN